MRRAGHSLIELLVVLTVLGALAALAVPALTELSAAFAVRDAARRVQRLFAQGREEAQTSGARTAVLIDPPSDLRVVRSGDTIAWLSTTAVRVTVEGTRDSMAYAPSGLAWGASNLRLILRRERAAETLFVSRLGRVRRSRNP